MAGSFDVIAGETPWIAQVSQARLNSARLRSATQADGRKTGAHEIASREDRSPYAIPPRADTVGGAVCAADRSALNGSYWDFSSVSVHLSTSGNRNLGAAPNTCDVSAPSQSGGLAMLGSDAKTSSWDKIAVRAAAV